MKKLFNINIIITKIILIVLALSFSAIFVGGCTNDSREEVRFFYLSPKGYSTMVALNVQTEKWLVETNHYELSNNVTFLSEHFYQRFRIEVSANNVEEFWELFKASYYESSDRFEYIMTGRTIEIQEGFVMGSWFHGELKRKSENKYVGGENENVVFYFQADGNLQVYFMPWVCEEYWSFEFLLFDREILNIGNVFMDLRVDEGLLLWNTQYLDENLSNSRSRIVRTDVRRAGEREFSGGLFGYIHCLYNCLRLTAGRNRIRKQAFGTRLNNEGQIEFLESSVALLTVRISRIVYKETAPPTNIRIDNHLLIWQIPYDTSVNTFVYVKNAGNEFFELISVVGDGVLIDQLGLKQGKNVVRLSSISGHGRLDRNVLRMGIMSQRVYFEIYVNQIIERQMPTPYNLEVDWWCEWGCLVGHCYNYFTGIISWNLLDIDCPIQSNLIETHLYIKWEDESVWTNVFRGSVHSFFGLSLGSQRIMGTTFHIRINNTVRFFDRKVFYENGKLIIITGSDHAYFKFDI